MAPQSEFIISGVPQAAFLLSPHARSRMQQRAVRPADVELALEYGEREWHFGDIRFTLTDRVLRDSPMPRLADRLRGLCVVLARDGIVKTVKWRWQHRKRGGVLRRSRRTTYTRSSAFPLDADDWEGGLQSA